MQVVVTTQPALGHLHPLVPLARALQDAGHDVVVACSPSFAPWVRRAGLAAEPAGLDWLEADPLAAFPGLGRSVGPGLLRRAFGLSAQALVGDVLGLLAQRHAGLLVTEQYEGGGAVAAELAGVPAATLGIGFQPAASGTGAALPPVPLRGLFGLPDDPAARLAWPHLYLDAYPPLLQPLPRAADDALTVRPEPFQVPAADGQVPPVLPDGLVLVTLGSVYNRHPGVLERVVQGAAGCGRPLLVTVGDNGDPDRVPVGDGPVQVVRYLPLSAALPHAAAVVCHGGTGTVLAALAAGVPVVALPLAGADQHYNAFRVQACGAGLALPAGSGADEVRGALARVLADDLFRRNAERVAASIAAMPAAADVVPALEALAAG